MNFRPPIFFQHSLVFGVKWDKEKGNCDEIFTGLRLKLYLKRRKNSACACMLHLVTCH